MKTHLIFLVLILITVTHVKSQDIYLSPYQSLSNSNGTGVTGLNFSADAKMISVIDEKGGVAIWTLEDNKIVKQLPASERVMFACFAERDKKLVTVSSSGMITQYRTDNFSVTHTASTGARIKLVNIDPALETLVLYSGDNQLQLFDLKANLLHAKISIASPVKNPMFVGYDRFGQQLFLITESGHVLSWNPLNQKFLRELILQSGEYKGSRSVLHAAAVNSIGDRFVIGLQEVFIPKGSVQNRNQPERRNMILSYDWLSGTEVKRVPMRYRVDQMTFGPGAGHVAYLSEDAMQIWMVNLEKAEVTSSVTLTDVPSALSIAGTGDYLAVGTSKGLVNVYYIERNTPAAIKVVTPGLDRSYASHVVRSNRTVVSGSVEGSERISKIFINDQEAQLDADKKFSGEVDLAPGKNKIRITAQNTEMKTTAKDFYITYEPDPKDKATKVIQPKPVKKKVALVIGNASYQHTNKLNNTVNDANEMASTLYQLGFDVIKVTDGNYEQMKNAVYAFGDRVQDVDVSLFYYAGHGLEVEGTNYLVPVDADIQSVLDVRQKTIPLPGVLRTIEVTNNEGLNMVILDACRNNPFPTGKRGGSGLAKVNAPSGTIIAYATDPGSVASDGIGAHGLYTGELIKQMKVSQRIEDVFMNTRNQVEDLSKGAQRPWEEARLKGVFYLK